MSVYLLWLSICILKMVSSFVAQDLPVPHFQLSSDQFQVNGTCLWKNVKRWSRVFVVVVCVFLCVCVRACTAICAEKDGWLLYRPALTKALKGHWGSIRGFPFIDSWRGYSISTFHWKHTNIPHHITDLNIDNYFKPRRDWGEKVVLLHLQML